MMNGKQLLQWCKAGKLSHFMWFQTPQAQPLHRTTLRSISKENSAPYIESIFITLISWICISIKLLLMNASTWLTGKDPDAGKDLRQEEKGSTEDEMVGWHHRLNGHEFKQTPGDSEG